MTYFFFFRPKALAGSHIGGGGDSSGALEYSETSGRKKRHEELERYNSPLPRSDNEKTEGRQVERQLSPLDSALEKLNAKIKDARSRNK